MGIWGSTSLVLYLESLEAHFFNKWTLETVLTLFSCEIPVISKQGKDMKGIEHEDLIKISNMFQ